MSAFAARSAARADPKWSPSSVSKAGSDEKKRYP
jgi:hypothetical protein